MRGRIVIAVAVTLLLAAACSDGEPEAASTTSAPPPSTLDTTTTTTTTTTSEPTTTTAGPTTTTAPTTTTTPIPAEPQAGGTVRVAAAADLFFGSNFEGEHHPATLNPLLAFGNARELARLTVPGAYRIDADTNELVPYLVTEIPTVANGGVTGADGTVTVTYQIEPDATWEDGTPVTAADFAFTHDLIMDEDLPISPELRSRHELVAPGSVQADGRTLTVQLTEPSFAYEQLFEWVVPAHAVDPATFADDWNDRLWPAGGPFRLAAHEPAEDPHDQPAFLRFERNPAYWETDPATGDPLPYLDGIDVYAFGPAIPDRVPTWVTSGSVDLVLGGLVFDHTPIGGVAGVDRVTEWDTLTEVMVFQPGPARLDVNPASHTDELDYRAAVIGAIDRKRLADETTGRAVSTLAGVSLDRLEHDAWDRHAGAPARPGDLTYTTTSADATRKIAEAVATQLAEHGWMVTTDFEGDFFNDVLPNGRYEVAALRVFALPGLSGLTTTLGFFDPAAAEPVFTFAGVDAAAEYSALLADARRELDPERLAELLTAAETVLADHALVYPLVRRQQSHRLFFPDRVQGFVPNRNQGWDTWSAAWWWSPAG